MKRAVFVNRICVRVKMDLSKIILPFNVNNCHVYRQNMQLVKLLVIVVNAKKDIFLTVYLGNV